MADDERRAEIEAVADWRVGRKVGRTIYVQRGPEPSDADPLIGVMDTPALALAAVVAHNTALDRVRDARNDDYDEDSAGAECSRLEADLLEIHDALADPDEPSAINAAWIIERIGALKAAARSPQDEDHEREGQHAFEARMHGPSRPQDEDHEA